MTSFAIRCSDVTARAAHESGDLETSPDFIQLVGRSIAGATVAYLPPGRAILLCPTGTAAPAIPRFLRQGGRVIVCHGRGGATRAAALLCDAGVRTLHVSPQDATGRAGRGRDAQADPYHHLLRVLRSRVRVVDDGALRTRLIARRVCKTAEEIDQIKEACQRTAAGFFAVWQELRTAPNTGSLMATIRAQPHDGMSYDPILVVGEDIALRDLHPSFESARLGDVAGSQRFVLLDLGYRCGNYCSDVTRTFPASGFFTPLQEKWYGIVLGGYLEAEKHATEGTLFHELEQRTRRFMYEAIRDDDATCGTPLLSKPQECNWERVMSALMPHALGHSVGLNVHDATPAPWRLANDHVLAIEPGVYFHPDRLAEIDGISADAIRECAPMGGIRIENTIVLRQGRAVRLSVLPLMPADIQNETP